MQGGSSGIVYGGLKYQASNSSCGAFWNLLEQPPSTPFRPLSSLQARCIADVRADAGSTTFLAGTLSLKEENEVRLARPLGSAAPAGIAIPVVIFFSLSEEMACDLIRISNCLCVSK